MMFFKNTSVKLLQTISSECIIKANTNRNVSNKRAGSYSRVLLSTKIENKGRK